MYESEAAEALLSLSSPKVKNLRPIDDCGMVVDLEIKPQLILSTPETPLSPLLISGADLPSFSSFTDSQDLTSNGLIVLPSETDAEAHVPRHREPRVSKVNTILTSLEALRDG